MLLQVMLLGQRKKRPGAEEETAGPMAGHNNHHSVDTIEVDIEKEDTAYHLRLKLAEKINVSPDSLKLIFAGSAVHDDGILSTMDIGPATSMQAVFVQQQSPSSGSVSSSNSVEDQVANNNVSQNSHEHQQQQQNIKRQRYYVFCKAIPCQRLRRGKLRVRCNECQSHAVVLQEEPTCWNDVLTAKRLRATCPSEGCEDSFGQFYFRCVDCSERGVEDIDSNSATPLPQIRSNIHSVSCVTCGDIAEVVVDFSCPSESHFLCVDCFVQYATLGLEERRQFFLHPTLGYTLSCPFPQCSGCISDPHHFHLLGSDVYSKFQGFAAEASVMESGGIFCPEPKCGTAFLVEEDSEVTFQNRLVLCPLCSVTICRLCNSRAAECGCDANDDCKNMNMNPATTVAQARYSSGSSPASISNQQSLAKIRGTCKKCPKCHVSTERNGGCHHMTCRQCGFQWCWQCCQRWTEECQWDHWFE